MADSPELCEVLARLSPPALPAIDLGLSRVEALLARLGNPHMSLPPVIHVAGTNGKGSLVAYLQAIYEAAGYRVHRYTSPHLVRFNERIVLAGRDIADAALLPLLERVANESAASPVTFFEATTAAAFLAFAEAPADVLLLETGLGGRLDATNVIEKPLLAAITPIALDHCEFLGDTLAQIAGEKAGIMKRGTSCVVGKQPSEALDALTRRAEALGAALLRFGKEWALEDREYRSARLRIPLAPSLAGAHQFENAATACACVEAASAPLPVTAEQMGAGIKNARWPARLQRLFRHPWEAELVGGELWLDGGHNPHAAQAIAAWAQAKGVRLHLLCGLMRRKDAAGFLAPLRAVTTRLNAVPIPGAEDALPPGELSQLAESLGFTTRAYPGIREALADGAPCGNEVTLIAGSLYLAGYLLGEIGFPP